MESFEHLLLARQEEVHGWIDDLSREATAHGAASVTGAYTDPDHWARLADLEARALAELHAVDRALGRLKYGSFGLCEECGEPISFERLESRPWVARCEECENPATVSASAVADDL